MLNRDDNCYVVVSRTFEDSEFSEEPFYFSGFTVSGGSSGIDADRNVIISDCDICYNRWGISATRILNSNIHHNSAYGVFGGNSINCLIHHNGSERLSGTGNGGVYSGICYNCEIYKNEGGGVGGGYGSKFYDCNIYENYSLGSGGGLNESTAYNCNIYNNKMLPNLKLATAVSCPLRSLNSGVNWMFTALLSTNSLSIFLRYSLPFVWSDF